VFEFVQSNIIKRVIIVLEFIFYCEDHTQTTWTDCVVTSLFPSVFISSEFLCKESFRLRQS